VRLWIFSVCVNKYQQAFLRGCRGNGCWISYEPSLSLYHTFYLFAFSFFSFFFLLWIPLISINLLNPQAQAPSHQNVQSLSNTWLWATPVFYKHDLGTILLKKGDANPYSHLREFEQTCACLRIASMSDETLRWKLFPFSVTGKAKQWYNLTVESIQRDWEMLCSKFCLKYGAIFLIRQCKPCAK
jgi:bacteriorhodopsin